MTDVRARLRGHHRGGKEHAGRRRERGRLIVFAREKVFVKLQADKKSSRPNRAFRASIAKASLQSAEVDIGELTLGVKVDPRDVTEKLAGWLCMQIGKKWQTVIEDRQGSIPGT